MTDEARDPSTPPARLLALLEHHLDAVLENPVWPLLLVEQPNLWAGLNGHQLVTLLQAPRCPPEAAAWTLRRPHPRPYLSETFIAINPALPRALRRDAYFLRPANEDPRYLAELERALPDVLTADELALLRRGAAPDALTDAEFEQLAALGATGLLLALGHPLAPSPLLERLFDAGVPVAMERVARHPNLSLERLARFLVSPHAGTRRHAAMNPRLTRAQLQPLYDLPWMHEALAENPSLPREWLEALAQSDNADIRAALARNPSWPPGLLTRSG